MALCYPNYSFGSLGVFITEKLKSPSHECKMTFRPSTTYSDVYTDQTFHQFHDPDAEIDLRLIMIGFHGKHATGVTWKQATLTLGLAYVSIVETSFTELAMSFVDFSLWISLGTFSILLIIYSLLQFSSLFFS